jgi:hypothetical protein
MELAGGPVRKDLLSSCFPRRVIIMKISHWTGPGDELLVAAGGLVRLERLVATVKGRGQRDSSFAAALHVLNNLSRKEGIPVAIVGGMAAIYHGYERFTKDIDIVVGRGHLDPLIRVAPHYGIKVIWQDPNGWHKLRYGSVDIEVVPEGGEPKNHSPTAIPAVERLGVRSGARYASLEGWIQTKLASDRQLDRADVVQVLKKKPASTIRRIRSRLARIHRTYLCRFDELFALAEEEMEQERKRGGPR